MMKCALRRLVSASRLYAEIAVKENWFWRNSRRMVAVTSASQKLLWWQACFVSIGGVSSLWPCHCEILGVSRESDC